MAANGAGGEPARKAAKTGDGGLGDLSRFKLKEVLRVDADHKLAAVHAVEKEKGDSAVIIMDKKPFTAESLDRVVSGETRLSLHAQNDIYGNYDLDLPADLSAVKSTVIYPATERHVEKYRDQDLYLLHETYDNYLEVTLPCIKESAYSLQWVENVLEKKSEAERIVLEDPDPEVGFILAPDLKWDGKSLENLYLTAIVKKRGIKSLRDLTGEHVALLENVLEKSLGAIGGRYGVRRDQILPYLHYQPSYYHLHVHFVHLKWQAPGSGAAKAHLLPAVIQNLRRHPDYYRTATLPCVLKANDPLLLKYREAGLLQP